MTTPLTRRRRPTRHELESSLEAYTYRQVRLKLGGHIIKLIPVEKGTPDRLVILPFGRTQFIELKVTGGRVEPRQQLWHERISHLGHTVPVLTDRVEVDAWINAQAAAYDVDALKARKQYTRKRKEPNYGPNERTLADVSGQGQ